jgi:hypothetical protein
MACLWQTCRHWLEFAVSLGQGAERSAPPGATPGRMNEKVNERASERVGEDVRARAEAYHQRLFGILRAELDNTLALEDLLREDAADGAMALVVGTSPEDEDCFTVGPDLQAQLARKREVMLAHWQDVARLVPVGRG